MKRTIIAATVAVMCSSAYAADLGSMGVADLEERVAELEATTARKGNRKVSLEVSGHVHEAVLWWDGEDAEFINNPNNSSRFRFKGSAKMSSEWSAGFLMEFGVSHNEFDDPFEIRHQALYVKSKAVGTVWLGHTSTATDGIVEIDLSNGSVATTLANPSVLGGGIMDGGRAGVVRYISPDLRGFNISGAFQTNDVYDVALRYAGEFGQIRIAGGIGYAKEDERERVSGSASIRHLPSGLFASAMYGRANDGFEIDLFDIEIEADAEQYAGRLGFDRKLNSAGKTTVYGEYGHIRIKGEGDLEYWGGAIVQAIDAAAMDLYLAGRNIEADGEDDIVEIIAGARIKF
jgi:predicted porin